MAEIKVLKLSGAVPTAHDATVDDLTINNMTVSGNLAVNGTTTTVNTATLDVTDKNISVNVTGSDATAEGAGLTVIRTGTDGSLIYVDAAASKFKIGALGSEVEIADISTAQTLSNKTLTTPAIGDFTNATHTHTNAASGGQITDAALSAAVGVTKGGTGLSTVATGDVLYGSGVNTISALTAGTNGQVLTLAGGVPTWATATTGDITGVIAGTGLNGGGLSGDVTLNLSTVTETLGGTNQTTYATGDILYASGVNTLSKLTAGTNGQVLTLAAGIPTWSTAAGDITAVTAGLGLTGGGSSGSVNLDVNTGDGIQIVTDAVAVDATVLRTNATQSITTGTTSFATGSNLTMDSGSTLSISGTLNVQGVATGITGTELETLSNGSNADALHIHKISVLETTYTADGVGITADKMVYISAADTITHADNSALATARAVGFAPSAIAASASGTIQTHGTVTVTAATFTAGNPVYLDVSGGLTQTAPTVNGSVVLELGIAKNATDLELNIKTPIVN